MFKTIITFALLLCTLWLYAQPGKYNRVSLNHDYAQTQRALYQNANARSNWQTRQVNLFNILHSFTRMYSGSENALYLLAESTNLSLSQLDSLISLLDTSLHRSPYFGSVKNTRARIAVAETGKPFPLYSFEDTLGIKTDLRSFIGKTVLIDFWSSWCGPCRMQIPGFVKMYKKYQSKDFEIIGISMDGDKQAWLNAIKKDHQAWPHFCELVGFSKNKAAGFFHIYGIPSNFLVDKEGIIIGQDLSSEQVERYLSGLR